MAEDFLFSVDFNSYINNEVSLISTITKEIDFISIVTTEILENSFCGE